MQSKNLPDAQKDSNEHLRDTKGYHVEPNYCYAGFNEHPRDTKGHPLEPNCCHVGSRTMNEGHNEHPRDTKVHPSEPIAALSA